MPVKARQARFRRGTLVADRPSFPIKGKECRVRNHLREMIDIARRSGDRIGADGKHDSSTQLGAQAVRLARLAASIHLAETARLMTEPDPASDRALSMRELAQ